MKVLGIETSCDETAVALLDDNRILASIVASQDEIHAPFGGVVPELASRRHLELILPSLRAALDRAGTSLDQVDALAVTSGPGLVVCLLIGLSFSRALAFARKLPLVGVNHLEGHLMAVFAEKQIPFPFVGLVVSGGHTSLYRVEDWGRCQLLGQTLDDAAGEAFDKVAKILGLPYPGGREIDALSLFGANKGVFQLGQVFTGGFQRLAGLGCITSFCTAGYRCGRTGQCIMDLLRSGAEGKFCKLNAVLTFKEWLDDFASPATQAVGAPLLQRELEEIRTQQPRIYPEFLTHYERICRGERDLYF